MFKFERCPFLLRVFCSYGHVIPWMVDTVNAMIQHLNTFMAKMHVCARIPAMVRPYESTVDQDVLAMMIREKTEPVYSVYYWNVMAISAIMTSSVMLTEFGIAVTRTVLMFMYPLYLTVYNYDTNSQQTLWLSYWLMVTLYEKVLFMYAYHTSYWMDVLELCVFYVAVRYDCLKHLVSSVVNFLNRNKNSTLEETYRNFLLYVRNVVDAFCLRVHRI